MADKQFGGWYTNPATGKNERYWGGNVWTSGSDPTGGLGPDWQSKQKTTVQTSTPSATPATDLTGALAQQKSDTAAFNAQQAKEEQDFFSGYGAKIASQEPLTTMQQRLETQYGVPTAREAVQNLTSTIANLPKDVLARAQKFGLTESQKRELIGEKAGVLSPELTTAQSALDLATGGVTSGLAAGQAEQTRELLPFNMQAHFLSDRLARETTGYTQDKQNQLDVLLAQYSAGNTMTAAASAQLNALALQEDKYNKEKEYLAYSQQFKTGTSAEGSNAMNYLNNNTTTSSPWEIVPATTSGAATEREAQYVV